MATAVVLNNIFVKYGTTRALSGATLRVEEGLIYALCGPSGCGKTTLCTTLLGMTQISHGEVGLFPHSAAPVKIPGRDVGFMPQTLSLHDYMTGVEILYFYGMTFGLAKATIERRSQELLSLMDLQSVRDRQIKSWSIGQQRRISLACSMLHSPKLLILYESFVDFPKRDEPTVGVDPILREIIWNRIERCVREENATVIITTHYLQEAQRSDRVGFMRNGRVLKEGSPSQLLSTFHATSLDEVFYDVCLKDKGESESSVGEVQEEEAGAEKDPLPSGVEHWLVLKALLFKDGIHARRHSVFLAFQAILPLVVLLLFYLSIGRPLRDLTLGLVNNDNVECERSNITMKCPTLLDSTESLRNLSCFFVSSFGQTVRLVHERDEVSAKKRVIAGESYGWLEIPMGFSSSLMDRAVTGGETMAGGDIIRIQLDSTNQVVTQMLEKTVWSAAQRTLSQVLSICGYIDPGKTVSFGVNFIESAELSYVLTMIPGLVVVIHHLMAVALTADQLVSERESGLLQRHVMCGIPIYMSLVSQLLVHFTVIIPQAVLSTSVLLAMYYSNQVWAFGALFSLLLLQAMSGMCLGLLITSLCSSRDQVIQLGIAAVLPTFVLSGIIWPREAMPSLLKAFSEILPTTVSCDVAKSLMLKGDAAPDLAALGFGIPCLWIMAMVVLCKFHTVSWAMK